MQDPKFTKSPGCYLCKTVGQTLMLREILKKLPSLFHYLRF